MTLLVFN